MAFVTSIYLFIIGLSVGSFLNVLIDRLPLEKNIGGRSHCDSCKKKLKWNDLIPLISYFYLRGRCRYCNKRLSLQYPLLELLTGAVFLGTGLIGVSFNYPFLAQIALFGIASSLIVIFFADTKYRIIPDSMQVCFFLFTLFFWIGRGITPVLFFDQVLAAFIVMAPILLIFLVTRGGGMGFGDVKLAFTMGFFLGIKGGLAAVYIAFIIGAVFGIGLILFGRKKLKSKIAFGPFLVVGLLLAFILQTSISLLISRFYGL